MSKDITEKLDEEIVRLLNNLTNTELGSEECLKASKTIAELYKLRIEEEKLDDNYSARDSAMKIENERKLREEEIQKQKLTLDERKLDIDERRLDIEDQHQDRRLDIDEKKLDEDTSAHKLEQEFEMDRRLCEEQMRAEQLKEQKKDRLVKCIIAGVELVLPLAFYAAWMKRGLKFEETGTFTSTTFKGLFNKFRPTKK